jgi:hypothetical protein
MHDPSGQLPVVAASKKEIGHRPHFHVLIFTFIRAYIITITHEKTYHRNNNNNNTRQKR